MLLADVVLDIPTKSLDRSYTYSVQGFADAAVGCCVQVGFGHRRAVGFIMRIYEGCPDFEVNPIEEVLTKPFFNSIGAECAQFLSHRYVAPLSSCVRLFVPPGSVPKAVHGKDGSWRIDRPAVSQVESKWISMGPDFDGFKAAKNAQKQRAIMETVSQGEIQQSELTLLYGAISQALKTLEAKGVIKVEKRRAFRDIDSADIASDVFKAKEKPERLTDCQASALECIHGAIDASDGQVVLVDGVTGSGKTEVYLQAIERCLDNGRGAIVLVPEISLTPQTLARFRGRFGDTVALIHSKMAAGERFDQWDKIRSGKYRVVVGARSALFCPMENPGIIIIDEEHESTYKQESSPRYVSRDVAEWIVKRCGATLVLGSATPSIESLYRAARCSGWHHVELPKRANGRGLPKIEIIDMAQEFQGGHRSVFSHRLEARMKEELDQGHKVVLLLNQRGFAKFLLCRDCGFVPECSNCSTTLTYHEKGNRLVCHHCGLELKAPPVCPSCKSPYMKKFGIGTQRVESELRALLSAETSVAPGIVLPGDSRLSVPDGTEDGMQAQPCYNEDVAGLSSPYSDVAIIRMDADTTAKKGAHLKLLEEFGAATRAILLGTQMIAKGLDFDDVTLVGVINADTQLHLPDFRASERTFDLIEQVAGRAGRAELPGCVMVQTYEADSVAIRAAAAYDRAMFLRTEVPKRKALGFPPYVRMANILVWGKSVRDTEVRACQLHDMVEKGLRDRGLTEWTLLPATPCAFEKIRNDYRWHVVLKAPPDDDISEVLGLLLRQLPTDALTNMAIDVDPIDML